MNRIEMLTTLVDAAVQLPESPKLKVAIRTAQKQIERLTEKRTGNLRRHAEMEISLSAQAACGVEDDRELAAIAQANPDRFIAAGRCATCGFPRMSCRCEF